MQGGPGSQGSKVLCPGTSDGIESKRNAGSSRSPREPGSCSPRDDANTASRDEDLILQVDWLGRPSGDARSSGDARHAGPSTPRIDAGPSPGIEGASRPVSRAAPRALGGPPPQGGMQGLNLQTAEPGKRATSVPKGQYPSSSRKQPRTAPGPLQPGITYFQLVGVCALGNRLRTEAALQKCCERKEQL